MSLPSYGSYRDSGVKWLGEIPAHWKLKRLKFAVDLIDQKVDGDDATTAFIGLEHIESWTGVLVEDDESTSSGIVNSFKSGDVLFGKLRPYLAKVHVARKTGVCTTEALVLRARDELIPEFLFYTLVMPEVIENVNGSTYGAKMPRANWSFIGDQIQLLPPIYDQLAIVSFLDRETSRIDALIEKKRRLLELLEEKRLAVITQAVTRGLDPAVPMKDSGIEWLGEVPAHWEVTILQRNITKVEQGWSPTCEERQADPDEWAVLKSGCVNGGVFKEGDHKVLPPTLEPRTSLEVHAGDILMCRASGSLDLIGSVAKVEFCRPKLLFSDKTYRIFFDSRTIFPDFVVFALASKYLRDQIRLSVSGADGLANNIPQSAVKNYQFARPPAAEQEEIAQRLKDELSQIGKALELVNSAINHLMEYRSALITNAVTGKIDVRGLAEREVA